MINRINDTIKRVSEMEGQGYEQGILLFKVFYM